jgi:hypothetical protein
MLAKAKREGACGVAILLMQIGEPWWPLVEEAAISTWEIKGLETPFVDATPAYCTKTFSWLLCSCFLALPRRQSLLVTAGLSSRASTNTW